MSIQKVNEIFIGSGAALNNGTTPLESITAQIGIVGPDMKCLTAGDTISEDPLIYLVNKNADGTFKRSLPVKGTSLTGYTLEKYTPASKNVWAIGYNRATAAGSIIVNNSTLYTASILFKDDKGFYSERPERLAINFTSSSSATQLTIATQFVNAINNSGYGSSPSGMKVIKAVVVGDGTGAYGLTGASNYGVEMWGLSINQFQNTTYTEDLVYFKAGVDSDSGFETTEVAEIQALNHGTGTYNHIYNMENFFYGYEGVSNRRLWPIPTITYLTSATPTTSGTIAGITVTGTSGTDVLTAATGSFATAGIVSGSMIVVGGNTYEVKYVISTTKLILTSLLLTSPSGAALAAKVFYDVLTLSVTDVTIQDGAGVGQFSSKTIYIASPSIDAGATALSGGSTEGQDIVAILNDWTETTPLAPANVSI